MRDHFRAASIYAALTVVLTWPLGTRLQLIEAGDSAYFAWAMSWTTHALTTDPSNFPNANALYPLRGALFLDEPIVGTSLLALPWRFITDDAVIPLNVTRLLLFFLTALATRALALELGASQFSAFIAGALFSFTPSRVTAMGHISVLGTQFLPIYLLFLLRWTRSGRWKDAVLAGSFFGISAWTCGYHALLAVAILPLPIAVWIRRPQILATAPIGIAFALSLLLPLRALHNAALSQIDYERGSAEAAYFSVPAQSFLATHSSNRVWGSLTEPFRTETEASLFPGALVVCLAAFGLFTHTRERSDTVRALWGIALLSVIAFAVALGPEIRFFGNTLGPGPAAALRSFDTFRMIRVFARAGVFMIAGLSLLAAFGLDRITNPRWRVALGIAAIAELVCVPLPVESPERAVSARDEPSAISRWLAQAPRGSPVVELPMLENDGLFLRPRFDDSMYLLRSTQHWQPLANGFAGTEPPNLTRLRQRLRDFPSETSLAALHEVGIRYVVLHRRGFGPNRRAAIDDGLKARTTELVERLRDGEDSILELTR